MQLDLGIFSMVMEDWRLDPEESYASFHPYPVNINGKKLYSVKTELKIRPYPNPYGMGGSWGDGGSYTREELDQYRQRFLKSLAMWQELGLVKIETSMPKD